MYRVCPSVKNVRKWSARSMVYGWCEKAMSYSGKNEKESLGQRGKLNKFSNLKLILNRI